MSRSTRIILLIVLCFVLLFLLLPPAMTPAGNQSLAIARTRTSLHMLALGSRAYFNEYGRWPAGLGDFASNPRGLRFFEPSNATNDAWGRPVLYVPFDHRTGRGRVVSLGRDGKPGGTGPDADLEAQFGRETVER
jgi:hypothetical protein